MTSNSKATNVTSKGPQCTRDDQQSRKQTHLSPSRSGNDAQLGLLNLSHFQGLCVSLRVGVVLCECTGGTFACLYVCECT